MDAAPPTSPLQAGIPVAVLPAADARPAPPAPAGRPPSAPGRGRIDAVDLLRGIVMVVMMLDHTREFWSADVLRFDPSDLTQTTAALFLTRWVTHYCAPIFVFLAGTGAYLQLARGKPRGEVARFLATRGLWLVLLELTVLRVAIWFNADYAHFLGMLQVIWAIGLCMVCLAGLVYLPVRAVAALGVGIIALHNLLDVVQVTPWRGPGTSVPGPAGTLWMLVHQGGIIFPLGADGPAMLAMYPLLPWLGVMAAGYALGALYRWEPARRQRALLRLGLAATAAFVAIRAANVYGDPSRWAGQGSALFTVLSFLNVTKYPPSLLFVLMTLGPALVALAWFERTGPRRGPLGRALVTLGRVPFFFYLGQWIVSHALAVLAGWAAGQSVAWLFANPFDRPFGNPENLGFSLPVVYAGWIAGVLLLYPLCRWYAGVKARRDDWWLSYL